MKPMLDVLLNVQWMVQDSNDQREIRWNFIPNESDYNIKTDSEEKKSTSICFSGYRIHQVPMHKNFHFYSRVHTSKRKSISLLWNFSENFFLYRILDRMILRIKVKLLKNYFHQIFFSNFINLMRLSEQRI